MAFEQGLRQWYWETMHRRSSPQVQLATDYDTAAAVAKARAVQSQYFADLNYPNAKQKRAFPAYTCLADFAQRQECRNIVEIGAGLSTAVWARYAQSSGVTVCSVDASFARMQSYVSGTRHEAAVSKHVELIEGATIFGDDLVSFYTGQPRRDYGGLDVSALRDYIDMFQSRNCAPRRWHKINRIAGRRNWSAHDLMIGESRLAFPPPLLDLFAQVGSFEDAVAFLRELESRGMAGIISRLKERGVPWDLIFFDSGELASAIEWLRLKSDIAVGGFAAFHDIFFPKSIKNIIPCAAVMADPDWRMVFCDDSTRQGLLVAQRLR